MFGLTLTDVYLLHHLRLEATVLDSNENGKCGETMRNISFSHANTHVFILIKLTINT